jgi:hypothetical protein
VKLDHLFDWPSRHNVHLALPVMLIVSAGLHVAGVAAFQVVRPRAHTAPERSAQVYFLPPSSAEAARLAPLLAASDPALFSPAHAAGRGAWSLPETTYAPSFDTSPPALLAAPAPAGPPALPAVSSSRPVSENSSFVRPQAPPQPGLPTTVTFGGPLAARAVTGPEGFSFRVVPADGPKSLPAAEFLVAVSPDGRPLYFFPRQSSGSEALDRAALRYLAAARFANDPGASEPAWGAATFHWGADILAPPAP